MDSTVASFLYSGTRILHLPGIRGSLLVASFLYSGTGLLCALALVGVVSSLLFDESQPHDANINTNANVPESSNCIHGHDWAEARKYAELVGGGTAERSGWCCTKCGKERWPS